MKLEQELPDQPRAAANAERQPVSAAELVGLRPACLTEYRTCRRAIAPRKRHAPVGASLIPFSFGNAKGW